VNRTLHESAPTPDFNKPVLNPTEAAALLQIHPRTLLRDARQGLIPGKKVGRFWRFSRKDLEQMISTEKQEPQKQAA